MIPLLVAPALPVCDPSTEIAVVVDHRDLGGPGLPDRATCVVSDAAVASEVLTEAGVELASARTVPGFVCRVDGLPADDPCVTAALAGVVVVRRRRTSP